MRTDTGWSYRDVAGVTTILAVPTATGAAAVDESDVDDAGVPGARVLLVAGPSVVGTGVGGWLEVEQAPNTSTAAAAATNPRFTAIGPPWPHERGSATRNTEVIVLVLDLRLPGVPHDTQVTLGELAQMTAGYADDVHNPAFLKAILADQFYVLGLPMESITGKSMNVLLQQKVLGPPGLTNTTDPGSPAIPEPVLHAYTSARRETLGIQAGAPFLEESTFWNPSWTTTHGAIQTTNIYDITGTADAVGTGALLPSSSHQAQVTTTLRGKMPVTGCASCVVQNIGYTYGLGVVISGDLLLQNPAFGGYGAVGAYLSSNKIAIAISVPTTRMPSTLPDPSPTGPTRCFRPWAQPFGPGLGVTCRVPRLPSYHWSPSRLLS